MQKSENIQPIRAVGKQEILWFGLVERVVSGYVGSETIYDHVEVCDPGYQRLPGSKQMASRGLPFGPLELEHDLVGMFCVDHADDPMPSEWKELGVRKARKSQSGQ